MLHPQGSQWGSKLQHRILMTPNGDESCNTAFLWLSMGTKAALLHPQDPQWRSKLQCCFLRAPNGKQCCFLEAFHRDQSCSTAFLWLQMGTKVAMLHPQDPQWGPKLQCCFLMAPNGDQSCNASSSGPVMGTKAAALVSHGSKWGSKLQCYILRTPNGGPNLQRCFLMALYGGKSCNSAFWRLSIGIKAALLHPQDPQWGTRAAMLLS